MSGTRKALLVTFPIDLGSRAVEAMLATTFESLCDTVIFRFAADQTAQFDRGQVDPNGNLRGRLADAAALSRAVCFAAREQRVVVMNNVSPALFSYPALFRANVFITTDWTRKLYEPLRHKSLSPGWLTFLHRIVLRKVSRVLPMTDPAADSFQRDYGVPRARVRRVLMPFDISRFTPAAEVPFRKVRLLFIGGDLKRKGGDILLSAFSQRLVHTADLTMVTNADVPRLPGVTVERGVGTGSTRHHEILRSHDLLVLPTLRDAFPVVLGEAAASGLALATTRFALGAREVISGDLNGIICDTQDELINRVEGLCAAPERIFEMKRASRAIMETRFSRDAVNRGYSDAIWGKEH